MHLHVIETVINVQFTDEIDDNSRNTIARVGAELMEIEAEIADVQEKIRMLMGR